MQSMRDVEKFVLLCASLTDLDPIKKIQKNAPNKFFISAGIHPHHATETVEVNYDQLLRQLQSITPHAIGETGLDYFRNISPPDIQKNLLECTLKLQKSLISLYLHQRDAHNDFIRIIRENRKNFPKFVVHCFTGTQKELDEYLDLGAYIGLTGWICDAKRNIDLRQSIKNIPIEK